MKINLSKRLNILPLTPELCDDYLHFFDVTPHADELDEYKCYCVFWSSTSCEKEDISTAEKRRLLAEKQVKAGAIKGYLAYVDGEVVGWCNANTRDECNECIGGRSHLKPLVESDENKGLKIKSVFCFVVSPEYRRQGISGALLDRVCKDAKEDGFDFLEGYPCKEFGDPSWSYTGPYDIYIERGFEVCIDWGDRVCVRKKLNMGRA